MPITPIYASVLGLVLVFLRVRTILLRFRFKVPLGHGDQLLLMKGVRAHANFAEYVPISLLLIYFFEVQSGARGRIHLLCAVLVVGRLVHAYGVSQLKENHLFRVAGMIVTFAVIVSASVGRLVPYVDSFNLF